MRITLIGSVIGAIIQCFLMYGYILFSIKTEWPSPEKDYFFTLFFIHPIIQSVVMFRLSYLKKISMSLIMSFSVVAFEELIGIFIFPGISKDVEHASARHAVGVSIYFIALSSWYFFNMFVGGVLGRMIAGRGRDY